MEMDHPESDRPEAFHHLGKIVSKVKSFMMTTCDSQGQLRSTPMLAPKQEFQEELWFFIRRDSDKMRDLQQNSQVNLSYGSYEDQCHVSLCGRGEIVQDHERVRELWSPLFKSWFSGGPSDPDLCLLKVVLESGEFWEGHDSKMVKIINITKAALTGHPYQESSEEHKRIDL